MATRESFLMELAEVVDRHLPRRKEMVHTPSVAG